MSRHPSDASNYAPYHRLVRVYPAGGRRDELLDTMIMAAEDDARLRPSGREIVDVLRNAPRVWLGRPGSRGVVLAAALFAVVTALLTGSLAAGAAAVAEYEPPTATELAEVGAVVAPGVPFTTAARYDEPLVVNKGELRYGFTWLAAEPDAAARDFRHYTEGVVTRPLEAGAEPARGSPGAVDVILRRAESGVVVVAAVIGGVAGLTLGWLLAGWASRRTEHHLWASSALAVLTSVPVLTVAPSVWSTVGEYLYLPSYQRASFLSPPWGWLFEGGLSIFTAPATVAVVSAAVVAVLTRPRAARVRATPAAATRRPLALIAPVLLAVVVVAVAGAYLYGFGLPFLGPGYGPMAGSYLVSYGLPAMGPEPGLTAAGVAAVVLCRIVTHLRRPATTASRPTTRDPDH